MKKPLIRVSKTYSRSKIFTYETVGWSTLGAYKTITFMPKNAAAMPGRTCKIAFGNAFLVIRINEVDRDGTAHGIIVGNEETKESRKKVRGVISANDLITNGIDSLANRK